MGVVVTVFMMLTLLLSIPNPVARKLKQAEGIIFSLAFLMGAWNAAWYGLQHIEDFWGMAAIFSGVSMMLTSVVQLPTTRAPVFVKCPICWVQHKAKAMPQGFHELNLLVLFGCAGIYSYTLIALNLQ